MSIVLKWVDKHVLFVKYAAYVGLLFFIGDAMAASSTLTVGNMASTITSSFGQVGTLIRSGSTIAGLGFSVGAIMKFKQHKDNPTQIPIGTPVALVFIAAALLFLPTVMSVSGNTMFGAGAKMGGPYSGL